MEKLDLILLLGIIFLIAVQMLIGALFVYFGVQGVTKQKVKVGYRRTFWEGCGDKAVMFGWIYIVVGAGFLLFAAYRVALALLVLVS